jgi:hypothetical protein
MLLGELLAKMLTKDPGSWGAFQISAYLWPFLVCLIPTIFFMGSLFFTLVNLTRKMMFAYILAITFKVHYSI